MSRIDKKYLVGAVVLAAIGVFVVLRARIGNQGAIPARVGVQAPAPADVPDEPVVATEPVRPLVPLIAPDADVAGGLVTVIGRVIDDESGLPIAGASIEHASLLATATSGRATSTDGAGEFRFEVRSNEPERMSISAPGRGSVRFSSIESGRPQRKTTGEVVRLDDCRMRRGMQPVVRVLDEKSKPVSGAKLVLCESPAFGLERTTRVLGVTDEHGEWTSTEPLSGSTSATFVLAGSGDACGFAPLALQPQGSRGQLLEVRLQSALELEVHAFTEDPIASSLTDVPINVSVMPGEVQGLWLATRKLNDRVVGETGWLGAKTGSDGVARVLMPKFIWSPQAMLLEALVEGFESQQRTVREEDFGKPVDVRMQRRVEKAVVHAATGSVLDANGHPVPGAVVRWGELTCTPDPKTGRFQMDLGEVTFDQARGLTVDAPLHEVRSGARFASKDPLVAEFVLDPLSCLRGRVVDESGKPLEGIALQLEGAHADGFARSRTDGSFCIAFAWTPRMHVDQMKLSAGSTREPNAPWLVSAVTIDDTQHVDVVMHKRPVAKCSVRAHVVDESSSDNAPVVQVVLMSHSESKWALGDVRTTEVVSDLGTFRAEALEPGEWDVGLVSSDDRVGSAHFHVSESEPAATIEVRVGPMRSIVGRVIPDESAGAGSSRSPMGVTALQAAEFPRFNVLSLMLSAQLSGKHARVGEDGTFKLEHLVPGPWTLVVSGPGEQAERTVVVTTREDSHVTLYAKPAAKPAQLQLTNLDSRFDGPLYVRLERDHEDPVEFVADPLYGRAQTFPVAAGKSKLVVYAMHDETPDLDRLPITRRTLDIPAGETCVVALYPR